MDSPEAWSSRVSTATWRSLPTVGSCTTLSPLEASGLRMTSQMAAKLAYLKE